VVGPDAYLSLPDLIAAVEAGEKAINGEPGQPGGQGSPYRPGSEV